MALDYSYRQLQSMQEDAIRRVREMERQAKAASQKDPPPASPPKQIDSPPQNQAKPFTGKSLMQNFGAITQKIGSIMNDDGLSEDVLLMALIVLLLNEEADMILILAIMYILSG